MYLTDHQETFILYCACAQVNQLVPRRPYIPIPSHCASIVATSTLTVKLFLVPTQFLPGI